MSQNLILKPVTALPTSGFCDIVDQNYRGIATVYTLNYVKTRKEKIPLGIRKARDGCYDIVLNVPALTPPIIQDQIEILLKKIC